jgi:hypothetical protein
MITSEWNMVENAIVAILLVQDLFLLRFRIVVLSAREVIMSIVVRGIGWSCICLLRLRRAVAAVFLQLQARQAQAQAVSASRFLQRASLDPQPQKRQLQAPQ